VLVEAVIVRGAEIAAEIEGVAGVLAAVADVVVVAVDVLVVGAGIGVAAGVLAVVVVEGGTRNFFATDSHRLHG
jgi:hypothetical protein